jgi:mono/diheme cytochrome c family protein
MPLVAACQSAPSDVRPWRATDHDHDDKATGAPDRLEQPVESTASSPHAGASAQALHAMRLWATKCMRCHGQIGLGDGPDGPANGVTNLNERDWLSAVGEERIVASIRNGRGKMPAFALGPDEVTALAALVRQMGPHAEPADAEAPSRESVAIPPKTQP